MGHDPRRQTTRSTTARKGGKTVNVRQREQLFNGFTLSEVSNRARSLGLSIEDFLSLSQRQREEGASAIGGSITRRLRGGGGGDDGLGDLPFDLGGGGGGGGSFLSSQAGQAAANAFLAQQAQLDRDFQLAEAEKARKFEEKRELDRLKAERQRIFTDMLGTDPVRAVLFALGVGGEILPGGDQFADLGAQPGAQKLARETGGALSKLQGSEVGVGQQGVTGLEGAGQLAAVFGGQGGGAGGDIADQQKLLLSAFGVGAKRGKGRPGQSREETLRQISSATPRGVI